MKRFFLVMAWAVCSVCATAEPLHVRDHEARWRHRHDRESVREEDRDPRGERLAERRERMRALREELSRHPPRPPYRDDEGRRPPPDRRDFTRPPLPPPREAESGRRFSPEERRQFRRQLHDAGRDVYRGQ